MGLALNCPVARDSQDLSCHELHPQMKVIEPQPDQGIHRDEGKRIPDGSMDTGNNKCAQPIYMLGWI